MDKKVILKDEMTGDRIFPAAIISNLYTDEGDPYVPPTVELFDGMYAAKNHTHEISSITGLRTELDEIKASISGAASAAMMKAVPSTQVVSNLTDITWSSDSDALFTLRFPASFVGHDIMHAEGVFITPEGDNVRFITEYSDGKLFSGDFNTITIINGSNITSPGHSANWNKDTAVLTLKHFNVDDASTISSILFIFA